MALTTVSVTTVTPRGGVEAAVVTVAGSGFGLTTGSVIFDPNGINLSAAITSWDASQIVFTVPAVGLVDQFIDVFIQLPGGTDGVTFPFWLVDATGPGLDYQWPALEAGAQQDVDDPRKMTAADLNRVIDRMSSVSASIVNAVSSALDKNLTPTATTGDGASTGITLSATPLGSVVVNVDGVRAGLGDGVKTDHCYFSDDGGVTAKDYSSLALGDTLYWNGVVAGFDLAVTDRIDLDYLS